MIRMTCANRGPDPAALHLLPTLWHRNSWAWGRQGEGYWPKGRIERAGPDDSGRSTRPWDGSCSPAITVAGALPELLFTDNETNAKRLFGAATAPPG